MGVVLPTDIFQPNVRYPPEIQEGIDKVLSLDPLELLALIIKVVSRDRIEDYEIAFMCRTYFQIIRCKFENEEK